MNDDVTALASHYDAFPYPTVRQLSYPLPAGFRRGALDMLLRRRAQDRLPSDGQIWIAGWGTQQEALQDILPRLTPLDLGLLVPAWSPDQRA